MNDLDLNYGALIACIFNEKLTTQMALRKMENPLTQLKEIHSGSVARIMNDNFINIEYMYSVKKCGLREIGEKYSVASDTVSKYLRKNGVKIRGQGNIARKKKGV